MMVLFRPTFITAVVAFIAVLSTFVVSASAAPQFGRPLLHVLDELSDALASTTSVLESSSISASSVVTLISSPTVDVAADPAPTVAGDPEPDPSGGSTGAETSDTMNIEQVPQSAQAVANSASRHISDGKIGLILAATTLYFVL
ncbi:hypothetical protein BV22DRAFT_1048573 [Leucogyrophana mollusca]|uniref:Uncharacterized protein n=1 Tax=Leucogyrophana mollusca TaxID=85980 RepID=A0ACB8BC60_9AGAM|nr:hypothetical protein BV22DRAFT_1048573 [Leucogyrophana mollusca]